jgi:hypothetical protein
MILTVRRKRGKLTDLTGKELVSIQPPVGKVGSVDAPSFPSIKLHAGEENEQLIWTASFEEFVRLDVAGRSYRISDFKTWSYTAKFKRVGLMEDNGSISKP